MDIQKLEAIVVSLKELQERYDSAEEGKLPSTAYKAIRSELQNLKKEAQNARVAILTDFKSKIEARKK